MDFPDFLHEGDVLVLNQTRVIAARVFGKPPSGGQIEVLVLHPSHKLRYDPNATCWNVLAKPGRKLIAGQSVEFGELGTGTVLRVLEDGVRELEFRLNVPFEVFLERAGRLPLPPYIHNQTAAAQEAYQTVFARTPGSVAAPTASLHFTQEILTALTAKGVEIVKLVLDIGLGTFLPIRTANLDEHSMHPESFEIPQTTVESILQAKSQGRRIVAAGTTVLRALEGSCTKHGRLQEGEDQTAIFITPGFKFNIVDALLTNFHLPRSTLLVLVCAFAGRDSILAAYAEAIEQRYRFFSFGDAMFISRPK